MSKSTSPKFSLLRYANCWEDADVLIHGLGVKSGQRALCIASGGDNALALLTTNAAAVLAIDVSPDQLYITELKREAFGVLSYPELLCLLGAAAGTGRDRLLLYERVEQKLSPAASRYWGDRLGLLEDGLVYAGKFERYFRTFRRWFLPLAHARQEVDALLAPKTDEAQAAYFHHHWNDWRWKALMRTFFNRFTMGRWGRDPAFFNHVTLSVPDYIIDQSSAHLATAAATRNPFLHMIFTGSYGPRLPLYLQPEHFTRIRDRLHRLHLRQVSAEAIIEEESFDVYALSNFFEYMSADQFETFASRCATHIQAGARLAYWNLMVPRSLSACQPAAFRENNRDKDPARVDNGFFYRRFWVEERLP